MKKMTNRLGSVAAWCLLLFTLVSAVDATRSLADENDNAAARAYNGAAALQNAGLHVRAAQKWTEFISAHSKDERIERAYFYLGICQLRSEKFPQAAETFKKVLNTWPKFAQADVAQYNLALARYEQAIASNSEDQFRQAAGEFSTVAAKFPKSDQADDALYFQGDCLFRSGDVAAALPVYQKLIDQYPNSGQLARAYYDLGIGQQELEKHAEAIKTFQAFLSKSEFATDELTPEIRLRFAICLHELDQFDKAAVEFDAASKIPEFPLASFARFRLGQTKIDQGKLAEAAQVLSEIPGKYPDSEYRFESQKLAGRCFYMIDKFKEAEQSLQEIAKANEPAAAEAAYWLGKTQLKLNQPDKALQTVEQAINRYGASSFIAHLKLLRIDMLYELPQRRIETLPLYEAFLQEFSAHELGFQARYMAALSALGQSEFGKARKYAEALLSDSGSFDLLRPGAMYIVAESLLLEDSENADGRVKALSLYRELISKYPDHARAARSNLRIGWCLQTDKKYDEAIRHLNALRDKFDREQQLPEAQLLIGQSHAALLRHREAIQAFDAAFAANNKWPRADDVLFAASQSHLALDEHDAAIGKLRKLVDTLPSSEQRPQALYRLGEITQQIGKLEEASRWFSEVAEKHPDSPLANPAMHAMTTVCFNQGDFPRTISWAERVIKGSADSTLIQRARLMRGLAYRRSNNNVKAIEDLTAYVKDPAVASEAITAGHMLALAYISQKQFPQAKKALDDLLTSKPDFEEADKIYYELAHALLAEPTQATEAAATFQLLAEKRPGSDLAPESWFRVAQYQEAVAGNSSQKEDVNRALMTAESALKNGLVKAKEKDLREKLQYKLGDVQFQQGRYAEAAKSLAVQLAEFPTGIYAAPAKFISAECFFRQNMYEQALPLYVQMVDAPFPEGDQDKAGQYRAEALYRAGTCAAELKRWQESEQHFRRLLDQHKEFPQLDEAMYGLGYALQQQEKIDQALDSYQKLTQQSETETAAKARFMIGEIAFGQERYSDAIEHFLLVTVGYPYESWQALARYETARCFSELGDKQRAIETLKEMIQKHPKHARIADAKRMLAEQVK